MPAQTQLDFFPFLIYVNRRTKPIEGQISGSVAFLLGDPPDP